MTRTMLRSLFLSILTVALPASASAQHVQVDRSTFADAGQDLRDALRQVSASIAAAVRDITADVARELGRADKDISRDVSKGLNDGLAAIGDLARRGAAQGARTDWKAQAEDRQTRPLAIGVSGAIEITNLSGDIKVTAGPGRDASVEIVRHAHGRTEADARLGLERVKMDVQVNGTRAVLKADYPNERQSAYSVSIDLIVVAPAGTRISISSVSGDVTVSGINGELSAKTISGDMTLTNVGNVTAAKTASGDVKITGAAAEGTLEAGTLNGDLTLQGVKARRIAASTVSGTVIARDVTADTVALNSVSGDVHFSGPLATNGRYELTTHSGHVEFSPSGGAGFAVTASSFNGAIATSLALQTSGARTRRQTLSGTVGDGSATVTLKTFSGGITVGPRKK